MYTAEYFLTARSTFPAVVAGGALRDTLLGKEVKDVDLFIPEQWIAHTGTVHRADTLVLVFTKEGVLRDIGRPHNVHFAKGELGITLKRSSEEYEHETGFAAYQSKACPGLNVIVRTDVPLKYSDKEDLFAAHVFSTFPVSISKVGRGMQSGEMFITDEFWETATTKTVMYEGDCDSEYLKRIIAKYPEGEWKYSGHKLFKHHPILRTKPRWTIPTTPF